MINTKDLQYRYSDSHVLSFSDISIQQGEQCLLKGQSGSGKTTLINLLSGMLTPTHGEVVVNNTTLRSLSPSAIDRFRAKNIGLIFQKNLFVKSINMYQNIALPLQMSGETCDRKQIYAMFEELNIAGLAEKKSTQLSQGELQRFSIARALANKPTLVIADEPTSSLDDDNCLQFNKLIKRNCQEHNATLLIATHDSRLEDQFTNIIRLK